MRVPFSQVFQINPDGSVSPKVPVHINGVSMGVGVSFTQGVSFGGFDITTIKGRDLDIEKQGDIVIIKGHF